MDVWVDTEYLDIEYFTSEKPQQKFVQENLTIYLHFKNI